MPALPAPRLRYALPITLLLAGCATAPAAQVRDERVAAIAPVELAAAPADWTPYIGKTVRITAPLTVIDAGTGEVTVSLAGRQWQPTERAAPGSDAARAIAATNARQRLVLDGDVEADPTDPDRLPAGIAAARLGSTVVGAEGVLERRGEQYRLQLLATPRLQANERPAAPIVAGDVRVAAFNLENLFNGDGRGGGFPTPRGARTPAQLAAQLAKLTATIRTLDPDVAALMELENDGYGPESSLAQLVAALRRGGGDWRFVDGGRGPGTDAIRVGLIYRGDRVRTQGKPAVLAGGPFDAGSRVPLAQAFVPISAATRRDAGPALVVAATHFKSKGCSEAEGADRDQGDATGCWNALRIESARRLAAWLKGDPTRSGSDLVAIIGDLNAYAQETPVRTLTAAGWSDAFAVAGIEAPYSYMHRGHAGRLDHALLSPALAARLRGAVEWHSNADEPRTAGYRAGGDGPWRSSDHDPLLLGFALRR